MGEIITILLSMIPIMSEIVSSEGIKMNRSNNGTVKQINIDNIRRTTIRQAVKQMFYVWLVVYTSLLIVLKVTTLVEYIGNLSAVYKIVTVIATFVITDAIIADLPHQVAVRKINKCVIGYNIDKDKSLFRSINIWNNLAIIGITSIGIIVCFTEVSIDMLCIAVIAIIISIIVGFKIYNHLAFTDREKLMLNWAKDVDIFELPPEAALRKVGFEEYRALFRFTFRAGYKHDNATKFDYYKYDFSLEDNGRTVVVFDNEYNVVAMFAAEDIVWIKIMIGANTITKEKEQGFSLKYNKQQNKWVSNGK